MSIRSATTPWTRKPRRSARAKNSVIRRRSVSRKGSPERSPGSESVTVSTIKGLPALESVAVIGAGYVGLPLCLQLAKAGLKVTGVDVDERVVRAINDRTSKIEEKEDFERFFADPEVQANLTAQRTPREADAFVIAVPTPVEHDTKAPDLRAVVAAAESLVPFLKPGNLVVVESTVPPLTTETVVKPILEKS